MKNYPLGVLALLLAAASAMAQHTPQQIAEDAMRHQALSDVMGTLGTCYAKAGDHSDCVEVAKMNCAGLAIGKFCGLREEAMSDPAKSYSAASAAQAVAAHCMSAGLKPYEECLWDLQTACKGLGVGKFCGMVHAHSF